MAESQELQVQQKREVEKKTEGTTPGRAFVPVTDIFETPEALTVLLEMPGERYPERRHTLLKTWREIMVVAHQGVEIRVSGRNFPKFFSCRDPGMY